MFAALHELKHYLVDKYYRNIKAIYLVKEHQRLLDDIRQRGYANVVFVVSNLAMWKSCELYQLLNSNKRFNVTIVLCPFATYSQVQKEDNMRQLRLFFSERGISFIDMSTSEKRLNGLDFLSPDILFYCQPYYHILPKKIDSSYYDKKLLCYFPYAYLTKSEKWSYNNLYQVVAWKLFYETEFHRGEGKRLCDNKGANIKVTGDVHADEFLSGTYRDVWKVQEKKKKRIIWAPHFTIIHNSWLNRGSFIWAGEYMLTLARRMSDDIQIAFKPHPRLKTELYKHPDWGKEKTEEYYRAWEDLDNGQLEEGEYVDLFMTSDAIIHDSGSFTVEYHYSQKPAMFLTKDRNGAISDLNAFGQRALRLHYFGGSIEDIQNFVDDVVLGGNDCLREERKQFFDDCLLPPQTGNVARNIYNDIVKSLGFEDGEQ